MTTTPPRETSKSLNNDNDTWYTMAEASIGVSPATKKSLNAAKPEGMPWNEFFETLLQAVDTGRFGQVAEAEQVSTEAEAIERARARYQQYRANPEEAITGTELRHRIHLRRLLESMDAVRGSLRLATDNPAKTDAKAIGAALQELDEQVHTTRDMLQAA